MRATGANFSSTPFIENQSLYWHPSIYEKTRGENPTYTRVSNLESSPYYRWDNSVTDPDGETTQAFPKDFKMIAYSDMENSATGGETGGNLFTECCDYDVFGEEVCTSNTGSIEFPTRNCAFLGLVSFLVYFASYHTISLAHFIPLGHGHANLLDRSGQ